MESTIWGLGYGSAAVSCYMLGCPNHGLASGSLNTDCVIIGNQERDHSFANLPYSVSNRVVTPVQKVGQDWLRQVHDLGSQSQVSSSFLVELPGPKPSTGFPAECRYDRLLIAAYEVVYST